METISDRINRRMKILGIKAARIVEYTGASKASVSKWTSGGGNPSSEYIMPLSQILRCSPEWLLSGRGGVPDDGASNVAPGLDLVELVPLLGPVAAGGFTHVDNLEPHEIEDWFPTVKRLNGRGFAMRVSGDSMTAPYGRSIPHGSIVIFDAGHTAPENGDLVLARLADSEQNEITFKKYVYEAGKEWLMPLNPAYPPIYDRFHVLAVYQHALLF